jgi:uncharacterized protein DUF5995
MPASSLVDELIHEYRTLDDVLQSLTNLQQIFYDHHDRRAIFVATYRLAAAATQNPALTVAAANRYRAALLAYETDDSASLPKSWKLAFHAARNNDGLLIQDLFLGLNAHINYDLPFALDREREGLESFQELEAAVDQVEKLIESLYAPALDLLRRPFQTLIRDITSFDLAKARQCASDYAAVLSSAKSDEERGAIARRIDDHSAVLARLILAPTARKLMLDAFRRIESISPWWRSLAPDACPRTIEPAVALNSLDELIARLKSIARQYDARRSRMSIDPAAQAEFCLKIKDALRSGAFADPTWVTHLNLHLGALYLTAVAAFDERKLDEVPDCWFMAFQMAATGENLLLQDVLAALNARYNHDFPLAVSLAGPPNQPDLEKFQIMFRDHIIEVEQSIVNQYTEATILPSLLAGPLQGILAEFPFDRALSQPGPDVCAITKRIVLKGLPGASWVIHALRHIESEWHNAASRDRALR